MMRSIFFEWKTVLRNPRFLMTVFLLLAGNLLLLFETDLFVHVPKVTLFMPEPDL